VISSVVSSRFAACCPARLEDRTEHVLRGQEQAGFSPAVRDEQLKGEIILVWTDNYKVYGVQKLWRELNRTPTSNASASCGQSDMHSARSEPVSFSKRGR